MNDEEWACGHCSAENYGDSTVCSSCNFPRKFEPLARAELLEQLRGMKGNIQTNHMQADALLLRYINDREIAEVFASLDKWYS